MKIDLHAVPIHTQGAKDFLRARLAAQRERRMYIAVPLTEVCGSRSTMPSRERVS